MTSPKVLSKLIKKFRLDSNSVLVVKSGTELAREDVISELKKVIERTSLKDVVVVVADDLDDIRGLNEIEMMRNGWYRSNIIRKLSQKTRREEEAKHD